MVLDTPWSASQIDQLREGQSADVMFVASGGQQYRIERRGNHSWSIVKYLVDDGPFQSVQKRASPAQAERSTGQYDTDGQR
jgi:hypothetical protein